MRLAIVSDVHGNLVALEAVMAAIEAERPDLVVHGGDLALSGPQPADVVDRVRELGWPGIMGNTDEALVSGLEPPADARFKAMVDTTTALLGQERIDWLGTLPPEWRHDGLLLVHASPGDLWRAPQPGVSDDEMATTYGGHGAGTVVYCHIHQPFVRRIEGLTVANSGSVGWPTDGDWRPSFLLIEDGEIEVRRVDYDLEREIALLRASNYPIRSWLEQVHRLARVLPALPLDP